MNAVTLKSFPRASDAAAICLCLCIGFAASMAGARSADADDASHSASPSIGLTYQVFLPSGTPRIYEEQDGPTYWKEGLAIAQGDQIQVKAGVASGDEPMVRFQARIDQLPPATVTTLPWIVTIDTKTLALGQHTLEVQAQLGGRNARLAKRTTTFTLMQSPSEPPGTAIPGTGLVTSVEGTAQVLSQGNVTSVSLPGDTIKPPPLIASKSLDGNALITLDLGTVDNASLRAGKPAVLDQAVTVGVRPQRTSSAHRYVFSLARSGDVLYASPAILDADTTRIRLQPKTRDKSGLLPGIVHLYVWGIDDAGNYGPVTEATLDVRPPAPPSSSGG